MKLKQKILGLCVALAIGIGALGPAAAQPVGSVDVSVEVEEGGAGTITIGLASGSSADFLTVPVNAVGAPGTGLVSAGTALLSLVISGDDMLYREGGAINLKLGTGTASGAFLDLTGGDPTFLGANQVDFQIPGRYLTVSGLQNPQQAKYTGGVSSSGQVWNGTIGRVPRAAGSATTGIAIYKVGDIFGTFNNATEACKLTTGATVQPWNNVCGDASFGEAHPTKSIAGVYPGSGFVAASQTIALSLDVPAGVYPGIYEGTLTLEESFS